MDNPYSVLELDDSVSHDIAEIKKAFRRLALRYHPDKNPDDPNAESRFDAIRTAHDELMKPHVKEELDNKIKAVRERHQRFAAQDEVKKKMARDLEQRERQATAARSNLASVNRMRIRNAQLIQEMQRKVDREMQQKAARFPPINDIDAALDFGMTITEEQREKWRSEFYEEIDKLFAELDPSLIS